VAEAAHAFWRWKLWDPFTLVWEVTAWVHFTAALCLQLYPRLGPKALVKVSCYGSVTEGNGIQDF